MRPQHVMGPGWQRALIMAIAFVVSSVVVAHAFRFYVSSRFDRRNVTVTGSATRRVNSDRAIWQATVSARAATLQEAYAQMAGATAEVRAFLEAQGATAAEVRVEAVETQEIRSTYYVRDERGEILSEEDRLVGYELTRQVQLTSDDLGKVDRIAQGVTELLQRGISVRSSAVDYLFTGLAALKIDLIEAATEDARTRAERVARASGATLGTLESASVGVVQVNAANETETSWDGMNDRSSIEKDAMVTVRTVFTLQ